MLFESHVEQSFEKTDSESYIEYSDWDLEENEYGSKLFGQTLSSCENMMLPPNADDVLLVLVTKTMVKSGYFPIDKHLQEVADWVNEGFAVNLPIHEHYCSRDPKFKPKFYDRSIADVFGGRLHNEKMGIAFFVGPVEGKVCFKMILSDLNLLKELALNVDSFSKHSEEEMRTGTAL